jgi:hypothetical protein
MLSFPVWYNFVDNVSILEKITCTTVAEIINPTTQTTNCTSSNLPWLLQENCEQNEKQISNAPTGMKKISAYFNKWRECPLT